jgi:hypothetical protein
LKFEYKNNSLLLLKFKENPLGEVECIFDNKDPDLLSFLSNVKNNEKSEYPDIPVSVYDVPVVKLLEAKELLSNHLSFCDIEAA